MKAIKFLLLTLIGSISLGLTSCQKEEIINCTNNYSTTSSLNKTSSIKTQSIALTTTENFSIHDFGYGACNISKSGSSITISNFKADCTIGPFSITPNNSSEPWILSYSNDDGIIAVNEYNSTVNNYLMGTTSYGSKTFYLHISKNFLRSGRLSVYYKNTPSVKSELVFNIL